MGTMNVIVDKSSEPKSNTHTDIDGCDCNYYLRHPIRTLAALFLGWKAILFAIVINCPGLGYDTSTSLLAPATTLPIAADVHRAAWLTSIYPSGVWKFVRWDAIYFVRAAERGYLFEQEWAFAYAFNRLLKHTSSAVTHFDGDVLITAIATSGVAISHLAHFLSVLVLHALTKLLFGYKTSSQKAFCLASAALHIVSPAGAFLSAPYAESLFSFLNFTGFYLYSSALLAEREEKRGKRDIRFLLAGVFFALASSLRGNGILSGCLFAFDAIQGALHFLQHGLSFDLMRRTVLVVIGGITVAIGTIIPQYLAWSEFCRGGTGGSTRPWCENLVPSIYNWVQAYYWNCGFLKYWTISNSPLFLLATPLLATLLYSSFVAVTGRFGPSSSADDPNFVTPLGLDRLAIAQGLLAAMDLTMFHVQIINRIASGYPVWYWFLATSALERSKPSGGRMFAVAVQGMAMYALIQAVLFGSFLPPA